MEIIQPYNFEIYIHTKQTHEYHKKSSAGIGLLGTETGRSILFNYLFI